MKNIAVLTLLIVCIANCGFCQQQNYSVLESPQNAKTIFNFACQKFKHPNADNQQYQQAFIMLSAAYSLDRNANYIMPEITNICLLDETRDYSENIIVALKSYVDENTDIITPLRAIRYLLERQNSREEKEATLSLVLQSIAGRNDYLYSEAATELGLLTSEKADLQNATALFQKAYSANPYNSLAFWKLVELNTENISNADFLLHNRMMIQLNPYDISYAMKFADSAITTGLYQIAYQSYNYCRELFNWMHPNQQLPIEIYRAMSLAGLNSQGDAANCLKLAAEVRNAGIFNITMESIAYKAALKLSDVNLAETILANTQKKALTDGNDAVDLSWFYSIVKPDFQQSLVWANKAYSNDQNSQDVLAILGLALAQNNQTDIAKQYLADLPDTQITLIGKGLAAADTNESVALFKKAVAINPASLEAQYALTLLDERKSSFVFETDPSSLLNQLNSAFVKNPVPIFVSPENLITLAVKVEGNEFLFSNEIKTSVLITNNSNMDIAICPQGVIKGQIVVDAELTGDINSKLPAFFSINIRPAAPIKPGGSIIVPIDLASGPIDEILNGYPQAGFKIKFTAYLDPVKNNDGSMVNSIVSLAPASTTINRKPIQLSSKYIQQRLNTINDGQYGQIVRSIRLFAGLIKEQQTMTATENTLYKMFYIENELLVSAIQKSLRNQDWTIRLQTLYEMRYLRINKELTVTLSELINDEYWPVRLFAMELLSKSQEQNFSKVLDWMAINDKSPVVRNFAVALGANTPQEQ